MAYSNWGAFVYKNGERRTDREDVAPFDDSEKTVPAAARVFVNILKNRKRFGSSDYPWWAHSHHAVLGDGPVRLTGYKGSPELWVLEEPEPRKLDLPEPDWSAQEWQTEGSGEVEHQGQTYRWAFRQYDGDTGGDMIHLELWEPDGAHWTAECGYLYGAGHMD